MWELVHKEGWAPKYWCFQIVVLEKAVESPLNCKEIKPVNPKGNGKVYFFLGSCLILAKKLKWHTSYSSSRWDIVSRQYTLEMWEWTDPILVVVLPHFIVPLLCPLFIFPKQSPEPDLFCLMWNRACTHDQSGKGMQIGYTLKVSQGKGHVWACFPTRGSHRICSFSFYRLFFLSL